ncbi:hypothetical protein HK100_007871 [Physocladia obscura]|uniref:Uncharacterized protein n=1 Tax=Physocladia obscura TaxID=109957 RepID=A0AAD5XAH1_9FUNG|nr:hypothetical protein HK100_007871 [Physocladia obscura]
MAAEKRIPRGTTNIKNESNDIFKFGGCLDFSSGGLFFFCNSDFLKIQSNSNRVVMVVVARYDRTPVATLEKTSAEQKKEREAARNLIKRNWLEEVEHNRWVKMAKERKREQNWLNRPNATKIGKNSVSYDPITCEYHKNSEGDKLREEDEKILKLHRLRNKMI